jgi:hypothetical protein
MGKFEKLKTLRKVRVFLLFSAMGVSIFSFQNCTGFKGANSLGGSTASLSSTSGTSSPSPSPNPSSGGGTTGVTAVAADTFLSSLGINAHIDQGVSGQSYVAPLTYLGVRVIRTGIANIAQSVLVHQQTGVLVNIFAEGDLTDAISAGKTLQAAGALLSFEGPNEPNNFTFTYNGQTGGGATGNWTVVADFQRDLYSAVKADATLKNYPVFGVSEEGAEPQNVGLQFLTIPTGAGATMPDGTNYADYVNVHNYVSSTQNTYQNNMAWNAADPTLDGIWDGLFTEVGTTWNKHFQGYTLAELPTVPRVTTETGWDSVENTGGDAVQGAVLVNTFLAQFKRGWRYTFIYQTRDGEGGDGNQGVFNSDSTPKLAATYIHNMTTILADTGVPATLGSLPYTLPNESSTTHDLLLQKTDGEFYLVVWDEKTSGTESVTVDLGGTHGAINVYDVTSGTTAITTLSNVSSVPLTMSDHPVILEIKN